MKAIVVLDACVLYPAPLRDLWMYLHLNNVIQAKWTNDIHEEWISPEATPYFEKKMSEQSNAKNNFFPHPVYFYT